ncbi:MAG TPA: YceI family protein [Leptospiraceae bacterium]|nr:YceI family protein [Leptospiraceae bacterium]
MKQIMKTTYGIAALAVLFAFSSLNADAVKIKEDKLKIESGKMLFTLIKTMAGSESKMTGLASQMTGSFDMKAKTFDITMQINLNSFALGGEYKFANDRMHETYLESSQYPSANYKGSILSYDPVSGKAKVKGTMTIHGTKKENVTIDGLVVPSASGSGYLLTADFLVNLKDYNIAVPDIKLATVKEIVSLKMKIELRGAK